MKVDITSKVKTELLSTLSPSKITCKHQQFKNMKGEKKGGISIVVLETPDFGPIIGISRCMDIDQFVRKTGYNLALDNALYEWANAKVRIGKLVV